MFIPLNNNNCLRYLLLCMYLHSMLTLICSKMFLTKRTILINIS